MVKVVATAAAAVALLSASGAAQASLIADGITYTLTEAATANPLMDQFTLGISGINGATDAEGDRIGVEAFAFNPPTNFVSAGAPSGFTFNNNLGLSANGCHGPGNYFCFSANTPPSGSPLAADSVLSFVFTETIFSGSFAGYDPGFKIDWIGTKNHYDLVSLALAPTSGTSGGSVPEPASLALFGAGMLGFGWLARRRSA